MFYKIFFCALLIFPNVALSSGCGSIKLSDFVILDGDIFVAFTVTDSHISTATPSNYIDISITREFNSSIIVDPNIRISGGSLSGPLLSEFTEGTEWLSVLKKADSDYFFAGCAPILKIENEMIVGQTGIVVLDELDDGITPEKFTLALNAYQQGISSADIVCRNTNSHCSGARATYDVETGVLNLPTVAVFQPIFGQSFTNAKNRGQSHHL